MCYPCIGKMVCLLWLLRHLTINLQTIVVRQESAVALVGVLHDPCIRISLLSPTVVANGGVQPKAQSTPKDRQLAR